MGRQALNAGLRSKLFATAVLGVCFAPGGHALADPEHAGNTPSAAVVSVDVPACETAAFSGREFRRLLVIELLAERLRVRDPLGFTNSSSSDVVLEIGPEACRTEARVVGVVLRGDRSRSAQRSVAVEDVAGNARPRALALAAAELVRETRLEWKESASAASSVLPERIEAPQISESIGPAADAARQRESEIPPAGPPPAGGASAGPTWRFFAPSRTSLFGGRLSSTLPYALGSVHLRADFGGAWASVADPLGTVNISVLSGAFAAFFTTTGTPALALGPRLELGYARGSGIARTEGIAQNHNGRALAAISLVGGLRATIHERWSTYLELELGDALSGLDVRADERPVASMYGPFISAGAGIAYAY